MPPDRKKNFLASIEQSHGQHLRRFLSARLRNAAADTPDLMQEVYLRLLRVDDHEAIRNPQAYLFTVANHVLHQHYLRQSSVLDSVALMDTAGQSQADFGADPATQLEMEQAFGDIERSLLQLSPRAYTTLILSRCDGVPLLAIADRLGVSRGQVKKYLAKALLHVRQRLMELSNE